MKRDVNNQLTGTLYTADKWRITLFHNAHIHSFSIHFYFECTSEIVTYKQLQLYDSIHNKCIKHPGIKGTNCRNQIANRQLWHSVWLIDNEVTHPLGCWKTCYREFAIFTYSLWKYTSMGIFCEVIKQNEKEVGDDMLLVSDVLLHIKYNYVNVELKTSHLSQYMIEVA